MTLFCLLAVVVALPVWAFLLATAALMALALRPVLSPYIRRVHRNRKMLAYRLFRRTGWLWPLRFATVAGGLPGTVIGITPNPGYAGQYSRNRYPIIESKLVYSAATYNTVTYPNNIYFGDAVVLLCDATGGTYVDAAQYVNNGGTFPTTSLTSLTAAPTALFAGFANREVQQQATYNVNSGAANTGLGYYAPGQVADVIVQGVATVGNYYAKAGNPAPVAGGPVFFRYSTNGAGTFVGALETAADAGHTTQIPNAFWTTGVVDTVNGTIEVSLVNPNIP